MIPDIRFRIKGDMATLAMIGENLGVSLIPELAIISPGPNLAVRPLKTPYYRTLGVCIRSRSHASPAAKTFIAETRGYIEKYWKERSFSDATPRAHQLVK